ncbi:MAG: Xaa-His dipeptidase, partial [Acutalibacteraceae bacterium]|nr:Xaa-His dipeptidase [Acutalibacteraceae bacterium]
MQYREEIHNYIQTHKENIVETLKELIKIPSVRSEAEENAPFGKECARLLRLIEQLYKDNGFETE